MKTQPNLLWVMLLLTAFGCEDVPIGFENNIGPSVFKRPCGLMQAMGKAHAPLCVF